MPDQIEAAIQFSLSALAQRQRVTNSNLANLNTPRYLARATVFEESLTKALRTRSSTALTASQRTTLNPTKTNGNNVDLDNETVTAMDTHLRYQTMVTAMNEKFRLLKTAMG